MIPTRIGQKFEGGYLAGVIRVRDRSYLILAAPKSTERNIPFKLQLSWTPGIHRVNDGWLNTNAMNDVEHPAAHYCRSLNVGGNTDWYLPSRDEHELCYRNLKPIDCSNDTYVTGTFTGTVSLANGINRSSIPTGAAYTKTDPAQTIVTAFQTGSVEAFVLDWYWTSTEFSAITRYSLIQSFSNGNQDWNYKTSLSRARGVRRVPILLNDEKHNDTD